MIARTSSRSGIYLRSNDNERRIIDVLYPKDNIEIQPSQLSMLGRTLWIAVQAKNKEGVILASHLTYYDPELGHAEPGLHGPADPDEWAWDDPEAYNTVRISKVKKVKLLARGNITRRIIDHLIQEDVMVDLVRAMGIIQPHEVTITPKEYVQQVEDALIRLNPKVVELMNEPNLFPAAAPEGMGTRWRNGREFADFWKSAMFYVRGFLPNVKILFPAMSPGVEILSPTPLRAAPERFLDEAESTGVLEFAEGLAYHVYWGIGTVGTWYDALVKVREFALRYPSKIIMVTEFSNPSPYVTKAEKGRQYAAFYNEAKKYLPANVAGLYSYCLSASRSLDDPEGGFPEETWKNSDIPIEVGKNIKVGR